MPAGSVAAEGKLTGAEAKASTRAKASGDPVEVVERRSEHEEVYALPDGTFRYEAHVQPKWVRMANGSWQAVDTGLAGRADGMVGPKATTLNVAFSGGGTDDPLVRIEHGGTAVELSWPKKLPAPIVSGATATYLEVWKDVDLQVRATPSGFTQALVVKTANAARKKRRVREITVGVRVTGGDLKVNDGGGLTLADDDGKAVAEGPAPQMWDSAGAESWPGDRLEGAGMGDRRAGVELDLVPDGSALTMLPDAGMLTGPDTVFPVYVDPPMSKLAKISQWLYLTSTNERKHNYWSSEGVGRCGSVGQYACTLDDPYTARQYFEFSTEGWKNKQVVDARFRVFQAFSFACHATGTQLKHVGEFGAGSDWGSITDGDLLASESTRHGSPTHCDSQARPSWVEFNSTALTSKATEAANNAWGFLRLGLRAADESDANTWKLFRNDAKLQIIYNTVPGKPEDPGGVNPQMACTTGSGRPVIGSATPQLGVTAPDADKQNLTVAFNIGSVGGGAVGTVPAGPKTAGSQFKATVTDGWLAHGTSYNWRARSHDGFANSPFSDFCEFTVDTERPNALPTVASADGTYPSTGVGGGPGVAGKFTLSAAGVEDPAFGNDVARYEWGLNNDRPDQTVAAPSLGGSAEIWATPDRGGPNTLYVRAVDRAGNRSDLARYSLRVNPQAPPVAKDTFARTVANGWGTADLGGEWSVIGNTANFGVDGGTGKVTMPGPGRGPGMYLGDVSAPGADVSVTVAPDKVPTGLGAYVSLIGRRVDGVGDYRAVLRLLPSGSVRLRIDRVDAGGQASPVVAEQDIEGVTYQADTVLHLRLWTRGIGTTNLKAKVWTDGESEPGWQLTGEDSFDALQQPGAIGLYTFLSGTADNEPVTLTVDDLLAMPPAHDAGQTD